MRNKAKGFPHRISLAGEPRAKAEFASRRANDTINDHPAERMQASTKERE
ncbi:small, acid-soluble spore protein K [Evansella sp. AB-P1]|nr:small, acid-soluble spore protein K [Evansella sp. AB-P1]MDG5786237.1 small, acid-soluble spore protein K [Evansella sp. AB-P1]